MFCRSAMVSIAWRPRKCCPGPRRVCSNTFGGRWFRRCQDASELIPAPKSWKVRTAAPRRASISFVFCCPSLDAAVDMARIQKKGKKDPRNVVVPIALR